jgi:hypothetical protein
MPYHSATFAEGHEAGRVHRPHYLLGSITDKTLSVCEGDIAGGGTVALVVGNDLNTITLPNTDTTADIQKQAMG